MTTKPLALLGLMILRIVISSYVIIEYDNLHLPNFLVLNMPLDFNKILASFLF